MSEQFPNLLRGALLAAVLVFPLMALALEEDKLQEILIQGDSARLDEKTGEITYEGNVTLVQGSLRLSSHLLLAKREGGEVIRITASRADSSQQVSYSQLIRREDPEVTADADEMIYDLRAQTIELIGNAILRQEDVEFSGDTIRYDIARGDTEAAGSVLMKLPGRFLENLDGGDREEDEPDSDSP